MQNAPSSQRRVVARKTLPSPSQPPPRHSTASTNTIRGRTLINVAWPRSVRGRRRSLLSAPSAPESILSPPPPPTSPHLKMMTLPTIEMDFSRMIIIQTGMINGGLVLRGPPASDPPLLLPLLPHAPAHSPLPPLLDHLTTAPQSRTSLLCMQGLERCFGQRARRSLELGSRQRDRSWAEGEKEGGQSLSRSSLS